MHDSLRPMSVLEKDISEMTLEERRQKARSIVAAAKAREMALHSAEREFIDPDPVRWIETHFYVPELNGPLRLGDYQKDALRRALSKDGQGLYNYSTVLWSDIKKSIKSTVAAAVTLWKAYQTEWGQIYTVANDLKQADSRVGYYTRRAIELNPRMRDSVKIRNYKIELPNRATIESIPIDPSGEAGSNADMVVFSELWGATGEAAKRMWVEMTLSPTKFGRSLRWVESYAGYEDTSLLLWSLYEQGVKEGERLDSELEIYENKKARLFALWNTKPRLPWQNDQYYSQEAAVLSGMPEEFNRVHRNQWASGSSQPFLETMDWWDEGCRDDSLPPAEENEPMFFAADAGWAKDVFALVGVSRHPTQKEALAVRVCRFWVPTKKLQNDLDLIEREIAREVKRWNVLQLTYDPTQMVQMGGRLRMIHGIHAKAFGQQGERSQSDRGLLDLIQQRRVRWRPETEGIDTLRRHIANSDRQVTKDRIFRIVKRGTTLPNDGCVALSMACQRGARLLWIDRRQSGGTTVQRGFR